MDKSDEKPTRDPVDAISTPVPVPVLSTPVPVPVPSDVELDVRLYVVEGLKVKQYESQQAVSMELRYSLPSVPKSWMKTYVLSLPAAAKLARGLQEAVDKCLYRSSERADTTRPDR